VSTRNAQLTELYLRYRLAEQQRFYRARAKQFQKARNQSRLTAAALLSGAWWPVPSAGPTWPTPAAGGR